MRYLFNIIIGILIFIILLPIFLIIILIIIVDRNNPIFIQDRVDLKDKTTSLYKFKALNANERKGKINIVKENDTRITRLGKFLRLTNIDELQQLINVIKGNMNLIGPRPLALSQDKYYQKNI